MHGVRYGRKRTAKLVTEDCQEFVLTTMQIG